MSFSSINTALISGIKAHLVKVECDIGRGTNAFSLIGLTDKAIDESADRVSAALRNAGYTNPKQMQQRTVISLAPANLRKEGTLFDLPIAISYLTAAQEMLVSGDILKDSIFVGELSLKGELSEMRGSLAIAELAKKSGFKNIFLPFINTEEAALVSGINVYGVKNLKELTNHLEGKALIKKSATTNIKEYKENLLKNKVSFQNKVDMQDIKSQTAAKRALFIAMCGGHNICLFGPPGTGKTMLARAARGLLPDLEEDDILEVTKIHSIAGTHTQDEGFIFEAPFRSPHHTSSYVSLVGGGTSPKPGEITLAHKGILFLDEFPEFEKKSLESLREPLEEGFVSISRAKGTEKFPAKFMLIAAMNPCPCGNKGNKEKKCICTVNDMARYERKISGPIMDRIDIWVEVSNISYESLGTKIKEGESSEEYKEKILKARESMKRRNSDLPQTPSQGGGHTQTSKYKLNRDLSSKEIGDYVALSVEIKSQLDNFAQRLSLSPRAYHRVLRVARTIADLDDKKDVELNHILEALQYRPKV